MNLFFRHKQDTNDDFKDNSAASIEVIQIKREGHKAIDKANKEITKVNDLLKANGITLKIHIASGARHGR